MTVVRRLVPQRSPLAEVVISELASPKIGGVPSAEFGRMVEVRNAIDAAVLGSDVLARTPEELLPGFTDQQFRPQRAFVASVDGVMVGRAAVTWWPTSGARAAVVIGVLPQWRERGVGTLLARRVDELLQELHIGATRSYALHLVDARHEIARSDPGARFLAHQGYTLAYREQVLALSLDRAGLSDPRCSLPAGVRLASWTGSCPSRWIADLAALHSRLSIDIPGEDPKPLADTWDIARVRAFEAAERSGGRAQCTVAALDSRTDTMLGFSRVDHTGGAVAMHGPALVSPAWRGRGVGRALMRETISTLRLRHPDVQTLVTNVASSNTAMLTLSREAGFRAIGIEGRWVRG